MRFPPREIRDLRGGNGGELTGENRTRSAAEIGGANSAERGSCLHTQRIAQAGADEGRMASQATASHARTAEVIEANYSNVWKQVREQFERLQAEGETD